MYNRITLKYKYKCKNNEIFLKMGKQFQYKLYENIFWIMEICWIIATFRLYYFKAYIQ